MNQGPNILKIQRSKKGQKKAPGTQPHLKDTSMFQSKKMAKKGRKKVKKAQKKSPEEAKAEVVEILVTFFSSYFYFLHWSKVAIFFIYLVLLLQGGNFFFRFLYLNWSKVTKCGKEEDEVLEAWDQFHEQFPEGLIPKEDFLASKKVN